MNKLMLMSGKKEHSNAEVVEVFSEVRICIYVGSSVLIHLFGLSTLTAEVPGKSEEIEFVFNSWESLCS